MNNFPRGLFGTNQGDPVERWQFRYELNTAPTEEPVTLAEMKVFARIDIDDDDALITALITAARSEVEQQTGRSLITQTWDAWLDNVPPLSKFELSYRPIQSITHIKSINEDDSEDEILAADIILDGTNASIGIKSTANPLTSTRSFNAFNIQYVAGYGLAADVPEWAKTAIKQIVAHWYEHRESAQEEDIKTVPYAIQLILDTHKVVGVLCLISQE